MLHLGLDMYSVMALEGRRGLEEKAFVVGGPKNEILSTRNEAVSKDISRKLLVLEVENACWEVVVASMVTEEGASCTRGLSRSQSKLTLASRLQKSTTPALSLELN